MLDLSGRLTGRGVQRGEGRRGGEEKKGKGEIGNGGVALAPREKFLRAPMLQFISTKLVYRWKAYHQNGYFVSSFTAFILNSSLTKI